MESRQYTVQDEVGLHARSVSLIARMALPYRHSKITVSCKGKAADATYMTAIMAMQIQQGDTIILSVEGGEEKMIADTILNALISNKL